MLRLPLSHNTVLADAAVESLVTTPDGTYVDATFGRGGHTQCLLARLSPAARVIGLDRDPDAVTAAGSIRDARFHFVHTAFSRLSDTLQTLGFARVDGVLLDLGVSSPQIDQAARGFSWRHAGPLDMRMDTTRGQTLAQWLESTTAEELTRVIRDYGEERFAASIAKAIVACRPDGKHRGRPLETTADLAAVVADAIPVKSRKDAGQHPATRTFQALRIHLNQELEELALVLPQILAALNRGGRLVVISFHSLEDRVVKRFIDRHAHPERHLGTRAERLPLRARQLPQPTLRALGKVRASAAEIAANPRARSAVMRIAERTDMALNGEVPA
ncbi:MAG: 16S rRNA (cytosine(1402)-N(4))-methyltransferase RsmH [Gemmatimonadota bacterium]